MLTSVAYLLLMVFGLLGNLLTILVVWLRPYMRSSTYLYLSSMAVSDMLILLLLPLELYKVRLSPRPPSRVHRGLWTRNQGDASPAGCKWL